MPKKLDPVYAYCQVCKEKKEMTQDYITNDGKSRTLRGKDDMGHSMQLVVPKDYKLT